LIDPELEGVLVELGESGGTRGTLNDIVNGVVQVRVRVRVQIQVTAKFELAILREGGKKE
jgi:hypothetical protein